jgi:hypothetical protein
MQHGLALWLENGIEYAHNLEYHVLAQQAADARRGLYDPTSCRYGPDQDIPIALSVNWDADGNDGGDHGAHLNGEWVEIRNLGSRNLPLGGWWLRDSGLIYGAPRKPGYVFPAGTVVPAGGSLRVHVGCGVNDLANAYWCRHSSVFENASYAPRNIGDGGYLFDPDGDLRAASMYPCVLDCTDPLQGKVRLDVHASTPEYVAITNTSAAPVDLRGYVVKLHMTGRLHSYVFGYVIGDDSQLNPGETMRLWIQHGGPAGRLVKNLDRRRRYVLPDGGGAIDLRTETDVLIGCSHWGRIHRCQ